MRSAITDIRALRGPDIESDHNLLMINFKVKLTVKTEKQYNEKRKIVNIFQNSKWKQEYTMDRNNRFEILENVELKYKLNLFSIFKLFLFIYLFFVFNKNIMVK